MITTMVSPSQTIIPIVYSPFILSPGAVGDERLLCIGAGFYYSYHEEVSKKAISIQWVDILLSFFGYFNALYGWVTYRIIIFGLALLFLGILIKLYVVIFVAFVISFFSGVLYFIDFFSSVINNVVGKELYVNKVSFSTKLSKPQSRDRSPFRADCNDASLFSINKSPRVAGSLPACTAYFMWGEQKPSFCFTSIWVHFVIASNPHLRFSNWLIWFFPAFVFKQFHFFSAFITSLFFRLV